MIAVFGSVSVIAIAALVLFGWVTEIETLKRILPGVVSMKPATATSFLIAGAICLELSTLRRRVVVETLCYLTVVIFAFAVAYGIAQHTIATSTGVETFDVQTVRPMEPSVMTMVALSIFCVGAILSRVGVYASARNAFMVVVVTGVFAIVGYLVGVEEMYYYRPRVSTAMAIHTAVLLAVIGKIGILVSSESFTEKLDGRER